MPERLLPKLQAKAPESVDSVKQVHAMLPSACTGRRIIHRADQDTSETSRVATGQETMISSHSPTL